VYVAYGRTSVLIRQGDQTPRGGEVWGVFFPIDNALCNGVLDPYKNGLTDRDAVWGGKWAWS